MSDVKIISIKSLDDIEHTLKICNHLISYKDCDCLVTDFSSIEYVTPIAAALFARELRTIVAFRHSRGYKTIAKGCECDNRVISYLKFIGFFDFIGLRGIGYPLRSKVTKRGTYIPITKYSYLRFKPDSDMREPVAPVDLIKPEAAEISCLFTTNSSPHNSLAYIISEIIRNAYEHSRSDYFFVFGQYWKSGAVELVFLDDGIGILDTLKKKYPLLKNQEDAILKSLQAGVSGASFDDGLNKYNNSGFGLYVVSTLAKKHGSFFISSNDTAISLGKYNCATYGLLSHGTLVCIRLDNIWDIDYDSEFSEIIQEGAILSSQGEYPISPSKQTWSFS